MKQILLLIPFLLAVSAARPKVKKATLEDVERGYITTKARLSPPPAPRTPAKSPTQFGFVPVKTASNYAQKEPKIIYAQPEYTAGKNLYNTIAYSSPQQYPMVSQYASSMQQYSPQYSPSSQQYFTGKQYSRPQSTEAVQKQNTQTQTQTQAYYSPQGQQEHYLNNYDNLQYVADNSVDQSGQQHYNQQQLYYLQQYQAPSTSIQAVVDPKDGLQYIMYIPTYVANQATDQTQNYESVVYANHDQAYQQPESPDYSTYTEKETPQYTTYREKEAPQYTTYTEKENYEIGKSAYTPKGQFIVKREPKSLLDSYVPSSLQLHYYKQAQGHLNSLQESQKYGSYNPVASDSTHHYNLRNIPFKP